jgi:formamidopyrimidine-DNA glycosylase
VPELPDLVVYAEALARRTIGERLERVRLGSSFVLRTVEPPLAAAAGRRVTAVHRLGKRLVLAFDGELFILVHLMRAGRLRWAGAGAALPRRIGLAALDFRPAPCCSPRPDRSGAPRFTSSAAARLSAG